MELLTACEEEKAEKQQVMESPITQQYRSAANISSANTLFWCRRFQKQNTEPNNLKLFNERQPEQASNR